MFQRLQSTVSQLLQLMAWLLTGDKHLYRPDGSAVHGMREPAGLSLSTTDIKVTLWYYLHTVHDIWVSLGHLTDFLS